MLAPWKAWNLVNHSGPCQEAAVSLGGENSRCGKPRLVRPLAIEGLLPPAGAGDDSGNLKPMLKTEGTITIRVVEKIALTEDCFGVCSAFALGNVVDDGILSALIDIHRRRSQVATRRN
jgi:hypothetical protein